MKGYYVKKVGERYEERGTTLIYDCDFFYPELFYMYFTQILSDEKRENGEYFFAKGEELLECITPLVKSDDVNAVLRYLSERSYKEGLTFVARYNRKDKPYFTVFYKRKTLGFNIFVPSKDTQVLAELDEYILSTTETTYKNILPFLPLRYLNLKKSNTLYAATPKLKQACLDFIEHIDEYWNHEAFRPIIEECKNVCESNGLCEKFTKEFIISLKDELED